MLHASIHVSCSVAMLPHKPSGTSVQHIIRAPLVHNRLLGKTIGGLIGALLRALIPPLSYLYNYGSDIYFLYSVVQSMGGFETFGRASK